MFTLLLLTDLCSLSRGRKNKRIFHTAKAGQKKSRGRGKLRGGDVVAENIYITEVKLKITGDDESSEGSDDDSTRAATPKLLQQALDISTEDDKNTAL